MLLDDETCYRALTARDARFDGVFFVGVRTTGIYCRPVCPTRTPGFGSCRFFPSAALAEKEGFRPCLRCRPELAPGHAPVDSVGNLARRAAARIEAGALNDGGDFEQLAGELRISSRQLRRAIRRELGVTPVELAQTNRLLLAKRLLGETGLSMIEVALASGFSSVRRFNSLFRAHYGLVPSQVRRARRAGDADGRVSLTLSYRPPFAWQPLLDFLAGRGAPGVECSTAGSYARTIRIENTRGWLRVEPMTGRNALSVELSTSLVRVLPAILPRLRNLFDLSARPDVIEAHLLKCKAPCRWDSHGSTHPTTHPASPPGRGAGGEGNGRPTSSSSALALSTETKRRGASDDPIHAQLAESISVCPGLRVPGAFDGFELAVRAILGQRVSVAAATTLAGRLAGAFGEPIETPFPCLNRLSPTVDQLRKAEPSQIARLGIAVPRARAIVELARAITDGALCLEPGTSPHEAMGVLCEIPGIGDWTAKYIAMRALRWPDAFPETDLGLLRGAGTTSASRLRIAAEAWRPWRAYAAMHLWRIDL